MERLASVSIFDGGAARRSGPEPLWEFFSLFELSRLSALPVRKRCDWESGRSAWKHAYTCRSAQLELEPSNQVEARNGCSECLPIPIAHDTGEHVRGAGAWRVSW